MRILAALASLLLACGLAATALAQPIELRQASSLDMGADLPQGLDVAGNHAYVAVSRTVAGVVSGGLRIVDLTNPRSPALVGGLDVEAPANNVAVRVTGQGAYAYVADGPAGLRVVDVTNPAAPADVATIPLNGSASYARLSGDRLYVAVGALSANDAQSFRGLVILDASDPAALQELGRFAVEPPMPVASPLSGSPTGVDVAGSVAYVSASYAGVFIVDVSDPAAPRRLSHYAYVPDPGSTSPNVAYDVKVAGDYMYVGQM